MLGVVLSYLASVSCVGTEPAWFSLLDQLIRKASNRCKILNDKVRHYVVVRRSTDLRVQPEYHFVQSANCKINLYAGQRQHQRNEVIVSCSHSTAFTFGAIRDEI